MLSSLGNCAVKRGTMVTYTVVWFVWLYNIICRSLDVVTVPPAQLHRQLNVDNM